MKHAENRGEVIIHWTVGGNELHLDMTKRYFEISSQKNVTFYVMASANRFGAAIPYQPTTIIIENASSGGYPWYIYAGIILLIAALAFGVYYFRNKAEVTQSKLDFEMNDIRNVARVSYEDDTVERANLQNDHI